MNSLLPTLPPAISNRVGWPWTEATDSKIYEKRVNWPRISIITPSFNQSAYLEETIRSVLLQNYPNLQFIVMDGGSTDGSLDIIRKYSEWLDHWESVPDDGQADAVNKGMKHANGEWINWLNSDDTFISDALHAMVVAGQSDQQISIVSGKTRNMRNGECFSEYSTRFNPRSPDCYFGLGVNQPGSLLRRDHVEAVGALRPELHLCMDLDLWEKLLLRGGRQCIRSITESVATYRYHDESKTCSDADTFALEEFVILHDLAQAAGGKIPACLSNVRRLSSLPSLPYEWKDEPNPREVDRVFAARLISTDNLLFRAILRARDEQSEIELLFTKSLKALLPSAADLLQCPPAQLEARALIEAQQSWGRLRIGMHIRALRLNPTISTIRAGMGILRAGWRN